MKVGSRNHSMTALGVSEKWLPPKAKGHLNRGNDY